eukprot:jgi/Botrbrau1/5444/Bobra.182_1s0046.1
MQFLRRRTQSKEEGLVTVSPQETAPEPCETSGSTYVPSTPQCLSSRQDLEKCKEQDQPLKSPTWMVSGANALSRVASHRISSHSDPNEVLYNEMDNKPLDEHKETTALENPDLIFHGRRATDEGDGPSHQHPKEAIFSAKVPVHSLGVTMSTGEYLMNDAELLAPNTSSRGCYWAASKLRH